MGRIPPVEFRRRRHVDFHRPGRHRLSHGYVSHDWSRIRGISWPTPAKSAVVRHGAAVTGVEFVELALDASSLGAAALHPIQVQSLPGVAAPDPGGVL